MLVDKGVLSCLWFQSLKVLIGSWIFSKKFKIFSRHIFSIELKIKLKSTLYFDFCFVSKLIWSRNFFISIVKVKECWFDQNQGFVIVPGHILLYCSSCKYYKIKDVWLFQDISFCTAAPAIITLYKYKGQSICRHISFKGGVTSSLCNILSTQRLTYQLSNLLLYPTLDDRLLFILYCLRAWLIYGNFWAGRCGHMYNLE